MTGKLEKQLKKRRPFTTPQQSAVVGLLRTHDLVEYRRSKLFREFDLSSAQYNILRILRGEGKALPSLEIAARMVTAVPGITRLLDRLEKENLISRQRDRKDRRIWNVSLSEKGKSRVDQLDQPLHELEKRTCKGLNQTECRQLAELLEKLRDGIE